MLILALTTLLAAGPVRDPLALYRDKPVLSVDVDAPEGEQVSELVRLTGIAPGYLLSTSAVETALKRLHALGRFSQVDLWAERASGAVALHFVVKRARRLVALEVSGLSHADTGRFVTALRLPPGSEVDRRTAEVLRDRGRAYLARVGLPRAELTVEERPAERDGVSLAVQVHEGEARRVTEVRFEGHPRVPPLALASLVHLAPGAVLDADELARDRERLLRAYLERGFLRVRVDPPRVAGADSAAIVTFPIDAGPRVALHFTGNRALSDRELRALWPAPGVPMQPGDIAIFGRAIRDAYRRRGYADATVRVRGHREAGGIERYLYVVDEQSPRFVADIRFEGARAFTPALLAEQVRTVLEQELGDGGAVQRLGEPELALNAGERVPVRDPPVPAAQRWVPEIYERVLEEIAVAYRDLGYLRVAIGPPRLEGVGPDRVRVVVPVTEGTQTRVESVAFKDATSLSSAELFDVLQEARQRRAEGAGQSHLPLPGAPLSGVGIEDARITLVRRYRDEGYLYARVFPDVRLSDDGSAAEVTFRFEEGPQVRIENLLVRGNLHTMPGLIRRRMLLQEGDLYRLDQALQDQRSVAALGVFSSVRVRLVDEETPAERKDVVAEVIERNRQAFELWPGLSTADGPRLRLDYSHLNLGGTATSFVASLKLNMKMFFDFYGDFASALRTRYNDFNFRERLEIQARAGIRSPRFGVRPVEGGLRLDLVGERTNALAYSLDSGRAIFGAEVFTFDRLGIALEPQASLTNLRCYTKAAKFTCAQLFQQSNNVGSSVGEGLRAEFKVGPVLTLDLRDDPLNPTRGLLASARWSYVRGSTVPSDRLTGSDFGLSLPSEDWSGFEYTKAEASLSGYLPVKKSVLALTVRGGRILTGKVPEEAIDERFYAGGSTTMRGFPEAGMFADDVCIISEDADFARLPGRCKWKNRQYLAKGPIAQGGEYFALFKAEARIPLPGQLLLILFGDLGNVWLTLPSWQYMRLRVNPGFGLRFATPAGPIGIDVGFTPDAEPLRSENLFNVQLAVGVF